MCVRDLGVLAEAPHLKTLLIKVSEARQRSLDGIRTDVTAVRGESAPAEPRATLRFSRCLQRFRGVVCVTQVLVVSVRCQNVATVPPFEGGYPRLLLLQLTVA